MADLRRRERAMLIVRSVGIPWALLQVLSYQDRQYPPGVKSMVLALVVLLAVGNGLVWVAHRRTSTLRGARVLAACSLGLDAFVISGIVWLYAFDPGSALWAVLFISPLEGALRFQLGGAMTAWIGTTMIYVGREVWGSDRYDYPLQWNSITFRMGIGFVIALVAGLMARDLMRERERLARALEEVEALDELRAGLVSTLAHDVRNPLTAIRGALKTLLTRGERLDKETTTAFLTAADSQAERLTRLSGDLLDLARLEGGRLTLKLEDLPLRDAVDTALGYVEEDLDVRNDVDPDVRVNADPERLQQVFVNLATNARMHGAPPFVVSAVVNGSSVDVVFEDRGPGVPPDEADVLFDAFRSGEKTGSVGLGLAIVKALVEAQDGSVHYEPARPYGSRFVITLPAA
jgi:signal transduction histidine kinase